jgi:hypothetical protein
MKQGLLEAFVRLSGVTTFYIAMACNVNAAPQTHFLNAADSENVAAFFCDNGADATARGGFCGSTWRVAPAIFHLFCNASFAI